MNNKMSYIYKFKEDSTLTIFKNDTYKHGYINKNGEVVIPPIYKYAYDFHNGVAIVTDDNISNEYLNTYLINEKGKRISNIYTIITRRDDGTYSTMLRQGNDIKYGVLDENGVEILSPVSTEPVCFDKDYAVVYIEQSNTISNKNYIIDKKGKKLELAYSMREFKDLSNNIMRFSSNGFYYYYVIDKYLFIDRNYTIKYGFKFDYDETSKRKTTSIKDNKHLKLIDDNDNTLTTIYIEEHPADYYIFYKPILGYYILERGYHSKESWYYLFNSIGKMILLRPYRNIEINKIGYIKCTNSDNEDEFYFLNPFKKFNFERKYNSFKKYDNYIIATFIDENNKEKYVYLDLYFNEIFEEKSFDYVSPLVNDRLIVGEYLYDDESNNLYQYMKYSVLNSKGEVLFTKSKSPLKSDDLEIFEYYPSINKYIGKYKRTQEYVIFDALGNIISTLSCKKIEVDHNFIIIEKEVGGIYSLLDENGSILVLESKSIIILDDNIFAVKINNYYNFINLEKIDIYNQEKRLVKINEQ